MRYAVLVLFVALATLSSLGQTKDVQRLSVSVKKMSSTSFGFDVTVEVKNLSGKPVLLQLSPKLAGNPRLQALTVQQWDEKLGWQYVGPCRDIEGDTARTLMPQQVMEDTVPISDTSHGWTSAVCPRRIQHLGGKIRAILFCAYNSKRQFKKRSGSAGCQQVESPPVQLPK